MAKEKYERPSYGTLAVHGDRRLVMIETTPLARVVVLY